MTQVELAERSGVELRAIRNIEQGTTTAPGFPIVAKLAYALGLRLDEVARKIGLRTVRTRSGGRRRSAPPEHPQLPFGKEPSRRRKGGAR